MNKKPKELPKYKLGLEFNRKVKAEVIVKELKAIAKTGSLKPQDVVESARSKSSPIHSCFEWNNSVAAEKYRLAQASYLIRSVSVRFDSKQGPAYLRCFVSLDRNNDERRYEELEVAIKNPKSREEIVFQAWREYILWEAEYKFLSEFAAIFEAGREVGKRMKQNPKLEL